MAISTEEASNFVSNISNCWYIIKPHIFKHIKYAFSKSYYKLYCIYSNIRMVISAEEAQCFVYSDSKYHYNKIS